jgi:hypothetical protein
MNSPSKLRSVYGLAVGRTGPSYSLERPGAREKERMSGRKGCRSFALRQEALVPQLVHERRCDPLDFARLFLGQVFAPTAGGRFPPGAAGPLLLFRHILPSLLLYRRPQRSLVHC